MNKNILILITAINFYCLIHAGGVLSSLNYGATKVIKQVQQASDNNKINAISQEIKSYLQTIDFKDIKTNHELGQFVGDKLDKETENKTIFPLFNDFITHDGFGKNKELQQKFQEVIHNTVIEFVNNKSTELGLQN